MARMAVVFGTRPEAIKMAPVIQELQKSPTLDVQVAVTGQHKEMLDRVLELFSITPDARFAIMQPGQSLTDVLLQVIRTVDALLGDWKPDCVVVHGDTTTAFGAAVAGFYRQIPVAHVEAGLRTGVLENPFPEEANRRLTDMVSSLFFAPTPQAAVNLRQEGIASDRIFITGNTVIDALQPMIRPDYCFTHPELQSLDPDLRLLVVTVHRRESWGQPLEDVCSALDEVVRKLSVEIVFAMHKNPRLQETIYARLGGRERVHLIDAPDYLEFINLLGRAYLLVTDSGGLQEEAPALGKPVLLLREVTERPEGVAAGIVKLIGTKKKDIVQTITNLVLDPQMYEKMARTVNLYGDGRAAFRIRAILEERFGCTEGNNDNKT